jgi:dTDP-4-amino-4,6-dideoxygalactose transaminase
MCAFSFHPVKAITTGEGGAVTTNSPELADRMRVFRHHGIVPEPAGGGWYYEIARAGYNYRLTDIQAALGTSQLAKLDRFIACRQTLASAYRARLAGLPLELPPEPTAGFSHAYHLFPVRVRDRRRVYDGLTEAGIGVQVHFVPIYRHPIYRDAGVSPADFPDTERAYEGLLSLPLYPDLTEVEQDFVVEVLAGLV